MPLAKCVRCNNLFDKSQKPVCTACMPDEDNDYDKVRDIVDEYPDMGAEAVSELADVPLQVVMRMLDQGMITDTSSLDGASKCGRCGADAISVSKRLCHSCLDDLNKNLLREKRTIVMDRKKEPEVGGATNVRQMLNDKRR